jgi:hypothetical protein
LIEFNLTFKEVGYDGMVQPDHDVTAAGDITRGAPTRPSSTGYIKALIQLADLA